VAHRKYKRVAYTSCANDISHCSCCVRVLQTAASAAARTAARAAPARAEATGR
jgi:hypothetical protein